MNFKEMKQVVDLLDKEWNLGKKEAGAKTKICAWIYFFNFLKEAEEIIIHKENNKVVGICGYADERKKKFKFKNIIYLLILKILYKSREIKNIDAFEKYENNYSYVPDNLENYFDGEISILVVDKNYRGKNIGGYLLSEIFKKASNNKLKNLRIETSESCSYEFYEKLGCKKIYETIVDNKEKNKLKNQKYEKAFLYEKKLI